MARRTPKSPARGPGLFDASPPQSAPQPAAKAPEPEPEPEPDGPRRLTVGELTHEIHARLAETGRVAVEGELSGLKRHTSGHVYFDLKDAGARLSCVVWRSRREQALRFEPEEGAQVVAHGKLDVYAPRGSYSLIVDRIEPLGVGALLLQLEELKRELAAQGRFDRKRPLPAMPACVGVVTSRDGAALRDFLRTRSLRWPAYPVRLVHTPVQGPGAADGIADAIDRLDASGVDVIVVCRGGGSLEDLWAFNERAVAEAIWRASVPVVSGVGHESDTTLADLVADHRAHTPTDAAQAVLPDRASRVDELERLRNYLVQAIENQLERRADALRRLAGRPSLASAEWILGRRRAELDEGARRLRDAMTRRVETKRAHVVALETRLTRQSPAAQVERRFGRLRTVAARLVANGAKQLEAAQHRVSLAARGLESTSPLAVLARGYSVTTRPDGRALLSADGVQVDDEIETRLAHGRVRSRVIGRDVPGEAEADDA